MFLTTRAVVVAGAGALAGALIAAITNTPAAAAVLVIDGLLLLAVVADVVTAPSPSSLRPVRLARDVATLGATEEIVIRIHNPIPRRLDVMVRDSSPPSLRRMPIAHHTAVPPMARADLRAEVRPERRGRIPVGPITIRARGRFGLAGRQSTLPLHSTIKVYPALPGRAAAELRLDRARVMQAGDRSSAIRGGGTEFDSLREYHRDDEFRRINWHATARALKPVSNVFREERNQQVLLVLDTGRMMAPTVDGVSRFEWGIDAAMAVADLAARAGDNVGMAAFARDLLALVPPRTGRTHPARILDSLFALEPTLDAPNYARVFASLLSRWRRRSMLVLITELTDESAMEPLLDALPILLRRHLVTVAAVSDPAVLAAALAIPENSEEVYVKAAAARALSARDRVAHRLRAMGAVVVDQPPGRVAGALADSYLRAKTFGRL